MYFITANKIAQDVEFRAGDVVIISDEGRVAGIGGRDPDRLMVVSGSHGWNDCIGVRVKAWASGRWWGGSFHKSFLKRVGTGAKVPGNGSKWDFPKYEKVKP